jgi:crossover junction endodeoxyribonuclease RuvC
MRVLGIDPAAAGPAGYGVVETDGADCRMLRFGALGRSPRYSFEERLCAIHALVADLVKEFTPDAVAIESVFTALNMKTALKLAEVRGVVTLAAAQAGIAVHSYAPREVKASVAGYGNASKMQMQQMVRATLHLSEAPQPSDAADALAVALCHIYAMQARERIARATGTADSRPPKAGIQPSR